MSRHRTVRSGRWPLVLGSIVAVLAVAVTVVVLLRTGSGTPSRVVAHAVPSASATTAGSPSSSGAPSTVVAPPVAASPSSAPSSTPSPTSATADPASALPVTGSTGNATQLITVAAASSGSTTALVQAWSSVDGRWVPFTGPVQAEVGADGLSSHPSESISATPIGSFTLTTAFGALANPGTALPYLQTQPDDWWISQPGPLYNTLQQCSSACDFTQGDPNEHLFYETPPYNYAVVIDYNTADAGPIVQGAGSAFFLHVSDGTPTAGCVSIPQTSLVAIMRWLNPADHPRILIGVR